MSSDDTDQSVHSRSLVCVFSLTQGMFVLAG